ncbi:MAG: molecular chaperone HtpG [Alphaproteobacteria bacterium]
MSAEKHEFQAEVSRLLDIVAHSLYSHNEIFVRELISNASDACDRLRYLSLTQPELLDGDGELKITLATDAKKRTLSVADNGIGMSRDDLIENLGTVARSGTAAFLEQLTGDKERDVSLIGQFGVGFYSSFMVADAVEVLTRRAGESHTWRWQSDGKGSFTIAEADAVEGLDHGTRVTVRLGKKHAEFTDHARLKHIVKTYSDHIALPIVLAGEKDDEKGEQLNAASALWTRPHKEITEEQYTEFYHHVAHTFDDPWLRLHNRQEGVIEYTNLLFIPSMRPLDLFHPDRGNRVKLYVRRVFITDRCEELLPAWLRFVNGIVDSEDLPLNISREMLQTSPVITKIRNGLVKRLLGALKKKAQNEAEAYASFWRNFGAVLKEGLYEDSERRDDLLALARFRSTEADGWISLADYAGRMKDGQESVYYITGDDPDTLAKSPQLEAFRARGVEVLQMTDPIDEFWMPVVGAYEEKPFQSVTRGDVDLEKIPMPGADDDAAEKRDREKESTAETDISSLTAFFKLTLEEAVKDVRESSRLTDSAVCLVADQGDMDMHLERILRQHKQVEGASKRILELNPRHPLIQRLAAWVSADKSQELADMAHLLLDQARIVEGEPVPDPAAFARRLDTLLEKGLDR